MCAISGASLNAEQKELLATQKSESEIIRSLKDSMKVLQKQLRKEYSYLAAEYEADWMEKEIILLLQSAVQEAEEQI